MNLVSNFAGLISPNMFGENSQSLKPSIDINDRTFADMLEKQLQNEIEQNKPNFVEMLGLPTGLDISNFENQQMNLDSINKIQETANAGLDNTPKNPSTSEILTFFSSLFENKPTLTDTSRNGLFDFERKTAANSYDKYARNIVTNLGEFVSDTIKRN